MKKKLTIAILMITSTLWDDDDYTPTVPLYVKFSREDMKIEKDVESNTKIK